MCAIRQASFGACEKENEGPDNDHWLMIND